ncbi:DUF5618 family protein [Candidatus Chrysopegis kryptomonas]|uniref:Uncharacterized protein, contains HEPN domain, UPF0332 family n=1 Tax=Candidatus Chryseopegocella kryptomonas TaxID=1633643 RepID=A0A0P1NWC7_9BACT|nr:DUF5618 family protein [Candidatus Chrysopegis kryptomonas]CUT03608.1 Uncharacterized protein, contains HEPN domain, UPF0332 family [Candidatus Chrysopegis kryptomonas]
MAKGTRNNDFEHYIREARRYLANAKNVLKNSRVEDGFYRDVKYVKMACGIAYSAVLLAVDGYLLKKGREIKKKGRKSVEDYRRELGKLNKKMLDYFNAAYNILHLSGYYDGTNRVSVVSDGLEVAEEIIRMAEER